jgi:hypothetical protein
MDLMLRADSCQTLAFPTTSYDLNIEGNSVTLAGTVERVPMAGTIDSNCRVQVTFTVQDLTRQFDFTLDPDTQVGSGSFMVGDPMCTWAYDATVSLAPTS